MAMTERKMKNLIGKLLHFHDEFSTVGEVVKVEGEFLIAKLAPISNFEVSSYNVHQACKREN